MGTILLIVVLVLLFGGAAAAIMPTAATEVPDLAAFLAWLFSFSSCFGSSATSAAWAGSDQLRRAVLPKRQSAQQPHLSGD